MTTAKSTSDTLKVEITLRAFNRLIDSEEIVKSKQTRMLTHARITKYRAHGLSLISVYNYIGDIEQFYIEDINA